jgi:hypothetical protein
MTWFIATLAAFGLLLSAWAAVQDRYHSPGQITLITLARVLLLASCLTALFFWPGKTADTTEPDDSTVMIFLDHTALKRPVLMEQLKKAIEEYTGDDAAVETLLYNNPGKNNTAQEPAAEYAGRYTTLPMALSHARWNGATRRIPGVLYISPDYPERSIADLLKDIPARWIGEPSKSEASLKSIRLPVAAFSGSSVEIDMDSATNSGHDLVELLFNDRTVRTWSLDQDGGQSGRFNLPQLPGNLDLRIKYSGKGEVPEEYSVELPIYRRPDIVHVTPDGRSNKLGTNLSDSGFSVKTVPMSRLFADPALISSGSGYRLMILDSINPVSLTDAVVDRLERAAGENGLRILFITGAGLERSARGSALERILPVKFGREPTGAEGERVALVCILDASFSMYFTAKGISGHKFTEGAYDFNKINMAKKAIVNITGALRDEDIFGVLTVRESPSWVLSPEPGRPAELVEETVGRIRAEGPGINLYSGLFEAYRKLEAINADIKHVLVFLDTADVDEYKVTRTGTVWELVRWFNDAGITISLIGFGKSGDKDVTDINRLADLSGGYFYLTSDIKEIPGFSMRDIEQISNTLVDFQARSVSHFSTDLPTVEILPGIRGQAMTTIKPGARLVAWSEKGYPLIASWPVGRGTVSVFTADSGQAMAASWTEDGQRTWEKILALITHPPKVNDQLFAQRGDEGMTVFYKPADGKKPESARWLADSRINKLEFTELSKGLFKATLPEPGPLGSIVEVSRKNGSQTGKVASLQLFGGSVVRQAPVLTDWKLEPKQGTEETEPARGLDRDLLILLLLFSALLLAVDELSRPD